METCEWIRAIQLSCMLELFFFSMFKCHQKCPKAFTQQIEIDHLFFLGGERFSLVSSQGMSQRVWARKSGLQQSVPYANMDCPLICATVPVFMCRRAAICSVICSDICVSVWVGTFMYAYIHLSVYIFTFRFTYIHIYSCIEWAGLGVHVSFARGVSLSCLAQVPWPNWLEKKFVEASPPWVCVAR